MGQLKSKEWVYSILALVASLIAAIIGKEIDQELLVTLSSVIAGIATIVAMWTDKGSSGPGSINTIDKTEIPEEVVKQIDLNQY